MANTLSAAKNSRKANRRHAVRVSVKSELKTLRRTTLELIEEKKSLSEINAACVQTCKKLATAASNGYIHKRTASRKISRIMKQVHKASQGK